MRPTGRGSPVRFEESRLIHGVTPTAVFDHVSDVRHVPGWIAIVSEAAAEGPDGVGRTIRARGSILGGSRDIVQRVTVHERPDHYAWAGDDPFPSSFDLRFAAVHGGTQVAAVLEAEPHGYFPLGGRLAAPIFKQQLRDALRRLARVLEEP